MVASAQRRRPPQRAVKCALPPDRNRSRRTRTRNRPSVLPWRQYSGLRAMPPFYFQVSRLDEARMNRTGLIIVLTIAIVAGVAFGFYPDLDLRIARHFYEVEDTNHNMFELRIYPPLMMARNIGLWIGTVLV